MKKFLSIFLIVITLGAFGVRAVERPDSLLLHVIVELTLPNGTVVARNITTNVPNPGEDATISQLMALAAQTISPQPHPVTIRQVRVVDQASDIVYNPAIPACEVYEIDSITHQPIVPLLAVDLDSVIGHTADEVFAHRHRDWKPDIPYAVKNIRFAWGAELGSSIDLSAHDMTSIDINMSVGLSYRWLIFAGLGLGADMMVNNSCRTYPLYLNVRTDFSRKVLPIFLDLRGGMAFNYLPENINQQSTYASISLGFNLATGRTFRSYILCGYTFNGRGDVQTDIGLARFPALSLASVRLGVQF